MTIKSIRFHLIALVLLWILMAISYCTKAQYRIPVQRYMVFNTNGLKTRDAWGLFDQSLSTQIKNNDANPTGAIPYISYIALDSSYNITSTKHYVNNNSGNYIMIRFWDSTRTEVGIGITLITSGKYQEWVTNTFTYNNVRFLTIEAADNNALNENIMELYVYGTATVKNSSVMPSATITAVTDPGIYAHGINIIGGQHTRTTSNGDTILKHNVAKSTRQYWTGPEFDHYPGQFNGIYDTLWLGRFGDPINSWIRPKAWGMQMMVAKSGGSIQNLSSGAANANTSYISSAQGYKYLIVGADPDKDSAWKPLAKQYANFWTLWGSNASAPLTMNVLGGSSTKGQGYLSKIEWDNEPNRFWVSTYYHTPLQYALATRNVADSVHAHDATAPVYSGATPGIDTMYMRGVYFSHYWTTGQKTFPSDGFNFNNYINNAGNTQQAGVIGVAPERYDLRGVLSSTQSFFQRHFPNKKVQWTEFGYSVDSASEYNVPINGIGSKTARQVQADWTLRIKSIAQSVPFLSGMYYYAFFEDGTYSFNSMGLVRDTFNAGSAYMYSFVYPHTYALSQEVTIETGYNFFSSLVRSGDSTGIWVTKKYSTGDTLHKIYKLWRGTSTGATGNFTLNLNNATKTAKLYTQSYTGYSPDSSNLTISAHQVTVPVTEGMSWLVTTDTLGVDTGVIFIKSVQQRTYRSSTVKRLMAIINFEDGTVQNISDNGAGSYVATVRSRYKIVSGISRLIAVIKFQNGSVQSIVSK